MEKGWFTCKNQEYKESMMLSFRNTTKKSDMALRRKLSIGKGAMYAIHSAAPYTSFFRRYSR